MLNSPLNRAVGDGLFGDNPVTHATGCTLKRTMKRPLSCFLKNILQSDTVLISDKKDYPC